VFADIPNTIELSYSTQRRPVAADADRVSLPAQAGRVPLLACLPPELAHQFADPSRWLLPSPSLIPRPFVHVKRNGYVPLIRKMLDCGMIAWDRSPTVINGVFAVEKSEDQDRLLIDCRPAGAVFRDPDYLELPNPELLSMLEPSGTVPFSVAKEDFENYFYQFLTPESWWTYMGLPAVSAAEFGLGEGLIYPVLKVVPMGFKFSPLWTQRSHQNLVYSQTSLRPCDALSLRNDFRLDRMRHIIIFDDLNLIDPDPSGTNAFRFLLEYYAMCDRYGLKLNNGKRKPPSVNGVEVLGIELVGHDLTVGLSPEKIWKLLAMTQRLLNTPKCSGRELARIVGAWTWAGMLRRSFLSVFDAVYRFIAVAGSSKRPLWPSVRSELSVAAALSPLLHVSLAAPYSSQLVAVDASMVAVGVSAANVGAETVANAAALAVYQRAAVKSAIQYGLLTDDVSSLLAAPVNGLADDICWSDVVSWPWRQVEHINSLETRAVLTAIRWLLSSPANFGRRLVVLSDSRVVVGALGKGRSSSRMLLPRVRSVAAWLLAFGCDLRIAWLQSEFNPADDASRLYSVNQSSREL